MLSSISVLEQLFMRPARISVLGLLHVLFGNLISDVRCIPMHFVILVGTAQRSWLYSSLDLERLCLAPKRH